MNLPNRLTVLRIIMTPLFMAAMLIDFPHHYLVALVLFAVASFTDMLDGKIARARNLVTNFGKFLDPLADKMLTTAAFLAFLKEGFGLGIAWVLFIVLFREFMIASLRLVVVSSDSKKVIAANIWGKVKTVSQMAAIIFGISVMYFNDTLAGLLSAPAAVSEVLVVVYNVLLWVSTVFAIISGVIYMKDSFEFVDPSK
ncbi:MAG: CDP-diacylglycerol--glycerol-3-phosphate 3-phosphatidyltransferase [Ruminococcaceae bacterium]|nr:CDP-diacylglycerol--glycerol-3-phosphate 3-phosphatidyltransferase [Oscillospiraceae bacterium]